MWRRPGGVTQGVKGGERTLREAGWEVEFPVRNRSTYYSIVSYFVIQKALRDGNIIEERAGTLLNMCKQGRMILKKPSLCISSPSPYPWPPPPPPPTPRDRFPTLLCSVRDGRKALFCSVRDGRKPAATSRPSMERAWTMLANRWSCETKISELAFFFSQESLTERWQQGVKPWHC